MGRRSRRLTSAQGFLDLHRVVQLLWIEQLRQQAELLAATASAERADLDQLRAVHEQIRRDQGRAGSRDLDLIAPSCIDLRLADIIRGLSQRQE